MCRRLAVTDGGGSGNEVRAAQHSTRRRGGGGRECGELGKWIGIGIHNDGWMAEETCIDAALLLSFDTCCGFCGDAEL